MADSVGGDNSRDAKSAPQEGGKRTLPGSGGPRKQHEYVSLRFFILLRKDKLTYGQGLKPHKNL